MRIVQTEIWIDIQDRWWNGKNEIVNEGVLKLFKMNLHFDYQENNYFIYLRQYEKEEKGYLKKVEGFPIIAKDMIFNSSYLIFQLDNDQQLQTRYLLYDSEKNVIWGLWEDRQYNSYLPFRLGFKVIQILMPYFQEDQETSNRYIEYNQIKISILEEKYHPFKIKKRDI